MGVRDTALGCDIIHDWDGTHECDGVRKGKEQIK